MAGTYKYCEQCNKFEYHRTKNAPLCSKCTSQSERQKRKQPKSPDEDKMSILF